MCEVFSSKCKVKLVKVHLACQSQLDRLRKTVFECVRLLIIMLKQRCNILNLAVLISQFTHSGIRLSFTCPSSDYNFLDFSIPFQALCTYQTLRVWNLHFKIIIEMKIVRIYTIRRVRLIPFYIVLEYSPKTYSDFSEKPVLLGKFESDINGKKIS